MYNVNNFVCVYNECTDETAQYTKGIILWIDSLIRTNGSGKCQGQETHKRNKNKISKWNKNLQVIDKYWSNGEKGCQIMKIQAYMWSSYPQLQFIM